MDFNASTAEVVTLLDHSGATVGSTVNIPGHGGTQTATVDMRQFNSYYLDIQANTSAPPTGPDAIRANLLWTPPPPVGTLTYTDFAEWWADPPSVSALGPMRMQDAQHGSFMQVLFGNESPDAMDVRWELYGTTRVLPGPYFRQDGAPQGVDGFLCPITNVPVGAGATVNFLWSYTHGRVLLHMSNSGGNTLFFARSQGTVGPLESFAVNAGITPTDRELILPKRSTLWAVNAPGGASSFNMYGVTLFDKV